jgi:ABC transporter substrate binding protein
MIRRRELMSLVGGAILSWPSWVCAEQGSKIARIGLLATGALDSPEQQAILDSFRQGLRERGYVEGAEHRRRIPGCGWKDRAIPGAGEGARRSQTRSHCRQQYPRGPRCKGGDHQYPDRGAMGDPVGDGLVASLARPGGNITGLTFLGPELATKRLELLKQALPTSSRVAALGSNKINDLVHVRE